MRGLSPYSRWPVPARPGGKEPPLKPGPKRELKIAGIYAAIVAVVWMVCALLGDLAVGPYP